ncbi:hypothetical protein K9U39_17490 [Rhodoblastus acidophilus]|uniref:MFS transporter n=1 Tax=Candidatus Rhodoblastus alkanivorans TaxID=2954117 RepID=A0ABS9Z3M5_9HYPH|nr:hypothetical protein [Candidatus Rhodoblastus alkanivorans]MCI4681661.1 hypothetical protein [Candidatus Rhodoblastus alkanivorans]MDI4642709.1 hypothetical protein [Rhodoblastus acidophilus]
MSTIEPETWPGTLAGATAPSVPAPRWKQALWAAYLGWTLDAFDLVTSVKVVEIVGRSLRLFSGCDFWRRGGFVGEAGHRLQAHVAML